MVVRSFVLLLLIVVVSRGENLNRENGKSRRFPNNLMFGVATASYQVEGAWNEDGKTENIWDRISHNKPCLVDNCDTGDVANDSYHQYKRDVEMLRELGVDFYRFSISWARILPKGFANVINKAGLQYYNDLIDELLKYNIQPMVTLYHWDLPQNLQDLGGWLNPYIVDWYTDYARVVFEALGDKVKYWITINEPREVCYQGYGAGTLAPLLNVTGIANYMCAKNLLIAHAKVWHMYNDEFRASQRGTIGITISAQWHEPESEDHVQAAEDTAQFEYGQYAHPIFSKDGDFPPVMKQRIAEKSARQGFHHSRLPEFTQDEVDLIKGSSDFFGINHYTTHVSYRNETVNGMFPSPSYYDDIEAAGYEDSQWLGSASSWLNVVPWGFYKLLTKIREEYGNPQIYITENGYSSHEGLTDDKRVYYYRSYLAAMLDAIEEGSDIRVYTAWSLMDNFEWMRGYTERFGLFEVDYECPQRRRTPRKSAYVYKEMLRTRTLDFDYEPDIAAPMTIEERH